MGKHYKHFSKSQLARRNRVEAELTTVVPLSPAARKLLSPDGFAEYYLEMQDLYDCQSDAYERLEEFHIAVTGRRRYVEFDSFRNVLNRKLIRNKI